MMRHVLYGVWGPRDVQPKANGGGDGGPTIPIIFNYIFAPINSIYTF